LEISKAFMPNTIGTTHQAFSVSIDTNTYLHKTEVRHLKFAKTDNIIKQRIKKS